MGETSITDHQHGIMRSGWVLQSQVEWVLNVRRVMPHIALRFLCFMRFQKHTWLMKIEEIGDECDDDYEKEVNHIIAFYVSLYIGKKISMKSH